MIEKAPEASSRPTLLFDRCNIYLGDGLDLDDVARCRRLIREYGGATAKTIENWVTHIVIGKSASTLDYSDRVNGRPIPIVGQNWIEQCGKWLNEDGDDVGAIILAGCDIHRITLPS